MPVRYWSWPSPFPLCASACAVFVSSVVQESGEIDIGYLLAFTLSSRSLTLTFDTLILSFPFSVIGRTEICIYCNIFSRFVNTITKIVTNKKSPKDLGSGLFVCASESADSFA